jgi:hypothetical protein
MQPNSSPNPWWAPGHNPAYQRGTTRPNKALLARPRAGRARDIVNDKLRAIIISIAIIIQ